MTEILDRDLSSDHKGIPIAEAIKLGEDFQYNYSTDDSNASSFENTSITSSQSSKLGPDDFDLIQLLGVGGFASVNLVRCEKTNNYYALKVVSKAYVIELNQQEHIQSEINIQTKLHNDFIVKLYKTFKDPLRVYMLLECCIGGELWTYIREQKYFPVSTAKYYFAGAIEALDYLHQMNIVFRDLKPENLLIAASGIPKLADFGFAKQLDGPNGLTSTFCGTTEYVAPEVILLENGGYNKSVDVWALGIFLYELLTGSPPFVTDDPIKTYTRIIKGTSRISWPMHVDVDSIDFICSICELKPSARVGAKSMDEIRTHPWFEDFDFKAFREHRMPPPILPKIKTLFDTVNFGNFPSFDSSPSDGDDSENSDFEF